MNRRFFFKALAATLGFFGLGQWAEAAPKRVFRYSKFFRRADQAIMDEFNEIVHLDETGKAHKVPVIWATDDKAAAYCRAEPDKIKLPLINIYRGDMFFNDKICCYYHLTIQTLYEEDMNQILEQSVQKFHPKFKNKIGEYTLMSMINNYYPGGSAASIQGGKIDPNTPLRGEQFSALKWGKAGEWILYDTSAPIRVLKHQLNMIVVMEGKP